MCSLSQVESCNLLCVFFSVSAWCVADQNGSPFIFLYRLYGSKYTSDKLWIVHSFLGRLVSVCRSNIPCLVSHNRASVSSYVSSCSFPCQSFVRTYIIICYYAAFHSLVVFYHIYCISVPTDSRSVSRFSTSVFAFHLQAQCTTYALHWSFDIWKLAKSVHLMIQLIQFSAEFKLLDASLTFQSLFLKL